LAAITEISDDVRKLARAVEELAVIVHGHYCHAVNVAWRDCYNCRVYAELVDRVRDVFGA
jgi:hypothetical protein